jgi:hypothetical protein
MTTPKLPTIDRMQAILDVWEQTNDPRAVFLGCYRLMTVNMLAAIHQNEFKDPEWVEQLLHHFAGYYFNALESYEDRRQTTPRIWQQAFEACGHPGMPAVQNLLLGVNAHINYDLIFTLVDMLQPEWTTLTSESRLSRYADHSHVNEVIYRTVDVVQDTVIATRQPLMEVVDRLLGPLDEWAISRVIRSWRSQVWRDAVALLEAGEEQARQQMHTQVENEALRRGQKIIKMG